MVRNLKALGIALVAVFALSAVVASAASAEPALFTAEGIGAAETAEVSGGQTAAGKDTFTLNGLKLTCTTATLSGKALAAGPSSTNITLTPKYEGCHVVIAGLTKTVTVTPNKCGYQFNATKNTPAGTLKADLTIECATGEGIEIHIYSTANTETTTTCTYIVTHQTINGGITLTNKAGGTITAVPNLNVSTDNTIKSAVCGQNAVENAVYEGEDSLQANKAGGGAKVNSTVS